MVLLRNKGAPRYSSGQDVTGFGEVSETDMDKTGGNVLGGIWGL